MEPYGSSGADSYGLKLTQACFDAMQQLPASSQHVYTSSAVLAPR
jgi:hypothetical protein